MPSPVTDPVTSNPARVTVRVTVPTREPATSLIVADACTDGSSTGGGGAGWETGTPTGAGVVVGWAHAAAPAARRRRKRFMGCDPWIDDAINSQMPGGRTTALPRESRPLPTDGPSCDRPAPISFRTGAVGRRARAAPARKAERRSPTDR